MAISAADQRAFDAYANHLRTLKNPAGFCVATVLGWISASDGAVTVDEEQVIAQVIGPDTAGDLRAAIRFAIDGEVGCLQLACEVLRQLDDERKRLLLQLAVTVALADGYLRTTELHILFFLADLLGFHLSDLDAAFRAITGDPLPIPGDVSSVAWWQDRETRQRTRAREASADADSPDATEDRVWALATLGVSSTATDREIKKAYLRLSRIHHPDQFRKLGEEAVRAAEATFIRIHRAYEILGAP